MFVYLAGPMETASVEEMTGWRKDVTRVLNRNGILTLDPTRRNKFHDQTYTSNLANKITTLDLNDIDRSDLLLVNLETVLSNRIIGSACEITYAWMSGKTIVTVLPEGYHHPFLESFSTEIHNTLDQAVEAVLDYDA